MSIVYQTLATNPSMFYSFAGAAPYKDISASRGADVSPTSTAWPVAPARGLLGAIVTSTQFTITVPNPPTKPYSLVTLAKALTTSSTNFISFYGNDGLWQVGNTVFFGVRHADTTVTSVSATVDSSKMHLLAGSYDGNRLNLHVDGVQVATAEVTNTSPVVNDNTLSVASTNASVIGMVAQYNRPVSGAEVYNIYQAGRVAPTRTNAVGSFFGSGLTVSRQVADSVFYYLDDNSSRLQNGAYVYQRTVKSGFASGLTTAGDVTFALPFLSNPAGFAVNWGDQNNATVSVSVDGGSTWTPATRGMTFGVGSTYTFPPLLKVAFTAGSTLDSYVSDIVVQQFFDGRLVPTLSTGREGLVSGTVSLGDALDYRDYPSLPKTFSTNGVIAIQQDTVDATAVIGAVQIIYTPDSADLTGTKTLLSQSGTLTASITFVSGKINFTGFSSVYVNKVAVSTNTYTLVPGVPIEIVGNYSSTNRDIINLGSATAPAQGTLIAVSTFPTSLSAGNITSVFDLEQDYAKYKGATDTAVTLSDIGVTQYGLAWTS